MIAVAGRHALTGGRRAQRAARRALAQERRRQGQLADESGRLAHERAVRAWRQQRLSLIADGRDPDEAGPRPVYHPTAPIPTQEHP